MVACGETLAKSKRADWADSHLNYYDERLERMLEHAPSAIITDGSDLQLADRRHQHRRSQSLLGKHLSKQALRLQRA
jgi:hypothetical protein